MKLGGLHDIVPAQLQDAPDYSSSAPLFLSSLYYLSGGASYYNPAQGDQATPLPTTTPLGGTMTADPATCTQIQCGAITQEQAGIDLLEACSAAGYTAARSCDDPTCDPYLAAMQANGMCASPVPQPSPTPMPSATTAQMPSIINTAAVVAPMPVVTPVGMAQRMPNIVNPAPAAIAIQPCGDTFAQWVSNNTFLAIAGLGLLAWMVMGKGK